jgi:hypothetical protein
MQPEERLIQQAAPESVAELDQFADEPEYRPEPRRRSRSRHDEHVEYRETDLDPIEQVDFAAAAAEWEPVDQAVDWDPPLPRPSDADALVGSIGVSPDHVWAHLPRCCGTCKDFRPASDERRGWCTNQWAFKHRRMVDANDRPCETSIGHWWVAADFAWQGDLDMERLFQPTPLMDKYVDRPEHDESDVTALIRRRPS